MINKDNYNLLKHYRHSLKISVIYNILDISRDHYYYLRKTGLLDDLIRGKLDEYEKQQTNQE